VKYTANWNPCEGPKTLTTVSNRVILESRENRRWAVCATWESTDAFENWQRARAPESSAGRSGGSRDIDNILAMPSYCPR
jgi:heme-degrading monooxygenase HmoA